MNFFKYLLIVVALSGSAARGQDSLHARQIGQCPMDPFLAAAVVIQDTIAFLPYEGLTVFNIADPRAPVQCGSLQTFYLVYSMVVRDSFAYLGTESNALYVVDIADPTNPTLLSTFFGPWGPNPQLHMAIDGDYLYIAHLSSGLRILDISNPIAPAEVGVYDVPTACLGVAVREGYAYLAHGNGGLRIVDVHDPESPIETGVCDLPDAAIRVAIRENYAYVADNSAGLRVVDVSSPFDPVEVGSCPTLGEASDVAIQGEYLYLMEWNHGIRIYSLSNPQSPAEVGYYDGPALQCVAAQGCLVLASFSDYVGVFDVSYFSPCTQPRAIRDATIQPISLSQIMQLRWTPVLDTNGLPTVIDHYEVYRAVNEELGDWQYLGTPAPPYSSVFLDSSATNATGFYQVRAVTE